MVLGRRLYGREGDVARVASSLAGTGRCTVVGPGGVGKTSVAGEVALAAADRGVVWIDAEPFDEVDALLDELVRQVELERLPGESPAEAIRSGLAGTPTLIVLDGVEHLGGELADAALNWPVSPTGPQLLMTSRRPLASTMLPVVRLDPLPTVDAGTRSPAGQMLLNEVAARGGDAPSLAADTELFGRVLAATGGLPAAIELTADHVARFGPRFAAEQATSVEEVIERCVGRTLTLLTEEDRLIFERLGLTAGSFTVAVVRACGAADAHAVAERLIEHGLLRTVDARIDMLPPIRDAATALLEHRGDTEPAIESLVASILQPTDVIDKWRSDTAVVDNLDTCIHLAWLAVRRPRLRTQAAALVDALFRPMYTRLRQQELLALLEAVLASDSLEPRRYADTARRAAICASECDTIAHARRWLDRAHQSADHLDDRSLRSRIWAVEGWLSLDAGDHAHAIEAAQRSIDDASTDDASSAVLGSLHCMAEASWASGDLDRAEEIAGSVVERAADVSPFDGFAARTTLGWCLVERGRHLEAVAYARHLADDIARHQTEPSDLAIETDLIAIAADPRLEPTAPSMDNDRRFAWWMRLQQRIRLAAPTPRWPSTGSTSCTLRPTSSCSPTSYRSAIRASAPPTCSATPRSPAATCATRHAPTSRCCATLPEHRTGCAVPTPSTVSPWSRIGWAMTRSPPPQPWPQRTYVDWPGPPPGPDRHSLNSSTQPGRCPKPGSATARRQSPGSTRSPGPCTPLTAPIPSPASPKPNGTSRNWSARECRTTRSPPIW